MIEIFKDAIENTEDADFITINKDESSTITFKLQNDPIKEVGKNGCDVSDILRWALSVYQGFNAKFPCRENAITITKLQEAIMWQEQRKKDREKRGVEGKNLA